MSGNRFTEIRSLCCLFWYMLRSLLCRRDEEKTRQAIRIIDPSGTRVLSRPNEPYDACPMNFLRGARQPAFRAAIAELLKACDSPPMAHEDIWAVLSSKSNRHAPKK